MPAPAPPSPLTSKPSLLRQTLESLLAVVFPSPCVLCGQELTGKLLGGACRECLSTLEPYAGSLCARCGLPLAARIALPGYLCADCRRGEPHFDAARSYGIYAGTLRAAVLKLKFHRRERLGLELGELLIEPWRALEPAAAIDGTVLIVPVPLHTQRERERGYNQARLLAEGFRRAMRLRNGAARLKLEGRCLVRRRPTAPQSGLSLDARDENVRGAFEVAATARVQHADVILVDDVMTTGATASACAAVLKRGGARRVVVLTVARATPQFPDLAAPNPHQTAG